MLQYYRAILVVVVVMNAASVARAGVLISSGATENMSCSGNVCTATRAGAVLNVSTLQNLLATADVEVVSGRVAKDITVQTPLAWTSTHTLTLDSYRFVFITAPVSVAGTGGLALVTEADNGGDLEFGGQGHVSFGSVNDALTINGNLYTLVSNLYTLASDVRHNESGYFALANNYDASKDGTFTSSPIFHYFYGTFEGLGNTISNLSVADPTHEYVGLFAFMQSGTISDVIMKNANISGGQYAGGIVGFTRFGQLIGDSVCGTVQGSLSAGGLAGGSYYGVEFSRDSTCGEIEAGANGSAGGLVGSDLKRTGIDSSHSSARVIAGAFAGGLAGSLYGDVSNSYATGAVNSTANSGGSAGGLVGAELGGANQIIAYTYSTGAVTAGNNSYAGGLVGAGLGGADQIIAYTYSAGAVTAGNNSYAGGLVGYYPYGEVGSCYSTASVTAGDEASVGGLVGYSEAKAKYPAIVSCYSTGYVTAGAGSQIGGLVGTFAGSGVYFEEDYWDTTTSGITNLSQGAGNISNEPGITGLTTAQLQSGLPPGFSGDVWGQSGNINGGLPYFLAMPPH
jgi:hypothetical protein